MKAAIIILFLTNAAATLYVAYKSDLLSKEVIELRSDLLSLSEAQAHFDENTMSREHRLQDSLEERLGSIEHNLDEVTFIVGRGKQK